MLAAASIGLVALVSSWDHTDECVEAMGEHGDLLTSEAERVAGVESAPEVGCDDTAGPPAYAVLDLSPRQAEGFDGVLARQGWLCTEMADAEDLPGVACTRSSAGVPLELTTAEFRRGPVEVWIYAGPSSAD